MLESSFFFAFLLALAIAGISILGGLVPQFTKLTHTGTQLFMASVAGFLVGVALLHIVPHGVEHFDEFNPGTGVQQCVTWMVVGIGLMFGAMRLSNYHQHESVSTADDPPARPKVTWIGILVGMTIHTMVEGFALGTSIVSHNSSLAVNSSLTIAVFLAIMLHKPLDALTVLGVMKASDSTSRQRWIVNFVFAAVGPVIMFLTMFVLFRFDELVEQFVGYVLSIVAGALLCLAMSDLLPEAQYHRHDILKTIVTFAFGLLVAFALTFVE